MLILYIKNGLEIFCNTNRNKTSLPTNKTIKMVVCFGCRKRKKKHFTWGCTYGYKKMPLGTAFFTLFFLLFGPGIFQRNGTVKYQPLVGILVIERKIPLS